MRKFFNLFYTLPFKSLLTVLIVLLTWSVSSTVLTVFDLHSKDAPAFWNVVLEGENFDFEDSYFFGSEIEKTIENVTEYSLKLSDKKREKIKRGEAEKDIFEKYFGENKQIDFALYNHSKKLFVSNISDIDGKKGELNVEKFFPPSDKTLIVHSAKNPFYPKGSMEKYVDKVQELSKNYPCDFDLYISFERDFDILKEDESFLDRHNAMAESLYKIILKSVLLISFEMILSILLLLLEGKVEPGGECKYSPSDSVYNDVKLGAYFVFCLSLFMLIDSAISMKFSSGAKDIFAGTFLYEYGDLVIKVSAVALELTVLSFFGTLVRHIRNRTLFSNTYIYTVIKSFRAKDPTTK